MCVQIQIQIGSEFENQILDWYPRIGSGFENQIPDWYHRIGSEFEMQNSRKCS